MNFPGTIFMMALKRFLNTVTGLSIAATSIVYLLAGSAHLYAQGEGNVWAFGNGVGIDFNLGSPVPIITNAWNQEGLASVSDASGSLLFYTNGKQIYNRSDAYMPTPGVGGLIPGYSLYSTTQASAIVPIPGSDGLYYVFSLESILDSDGGLFYSIIDMSLDGGMGDAIASDMGILIDDGFVEKMTVVQADCESAWLIVHDAYINQYLSYRITAAGIEPPVVSVIGTGSFEPGYEIGAIKISPDKSKMVAVMIAPNADTTDATAGLNGAEMYDFDATTGIISNRRVLIDGSSPFYNQYYGGAFSPDNSKLYISGPGGLIQFDLGAGTTSDIITSATYIEEPYFYGLWAMKLGPDGKIYIVRGAYESTLATIDAPNLAGTACSYNISGFALTGPGWATLGLPNENVSYTTTLIETTRHDTTICNALTLHGRPDAASYVWSTGAVTDTITATGPGLFWVKSVYGNNCSYAVDTFNVQPTEFAPIINLGNDTTICPQSPLVLDAYNTAFTNYRWSTGDTTATIEVNVPGLYYVTAGVFCGGNELLSTDSIIISTYPDPVNSLPGDTTICEGTILVLGSEQTGMFYQWSNGPGSCCIEVTEPGTYTLKVSNICGTAINAQTSVSIAECHNCIATPNVFSPNDDGINDKYAIQVNCPLRSFRLLIYNRWGQVVYTSFNASDGWNGTINGKPADIGTYFYYLEADPTVTNQEKIIKKGDLTLIR